MKKIRRVLEIYLTIFCFSTVIAMELSEQEILYDILNNAWNDNDIHGRPNSRDTSRWQTAEYMIFQKSKLPLSTKKEVYKKFYNDVLRNDEMSSEHDEISDSSLNAHIDGLKQHYDAYKKAMPHHFHIMQNKVSDKFKRAHILDNDEYSKKLIGGGAISIILISALAYFLYKKYTQKLEIDEVKEINIKNNIIDIVEKLKLETNEDKCDELLDEIDSNIHALTGLKRVLNPKRKEQSKWKDLDKRYNGALETIILIYKRRLNQMKFQKGYK